MYKRQLENVTLPLIYSNATNKDEKGKYLLEQFGLSHRLNFNPTKLSGGEKQRVAIARALVNDPEVIFADEPTGNLDSKSGLQVMKILQGLNKKGNTIILVTHEKATANHAKRIIRIRDGSVSYTHLDVYKRQARDSQIGSAQQRQVDPLARGDHIKGWKYRRGVLNAVTKIWQKITQIIFLALFAVLIITGRMQLWMGLFAPVSYTHLDVYKRQDFSFGPRVIEHRQVQAGFSVIADRDSGQPLFDLGQSLSLIHI